MLNGEKERMCYFFFSSRRRHTRWTGDWSSDVCSSDLTVNAMPSTRHTHSPSDDTHEHEHRHGTLVHTHPHVHVIGIDHDDPRAHEHEHAHDHSHCHGHGEHSHSHGLVDRSILRSHDGVRTVALSLAILGLTAAIQTVV